MLGVHLIQLASSLDSEENCLALEAALEATLATRNPDVSVNLVVAPEAFQRDFGPPGSDVSAAAEPLDGPFVARMTELAAAHHVTIVAGMFEVGPDPARPYNTLAVVDARGLVGSYRKIHLYDSFGYQESSRLSAGPVEPVVLDVHGLRVGLMTCYDLRFPELMRALVAKGAELVAVPSAWVAGPAKLDHWRTLLRARAIENTVYVAAAAQPGPRYTGHSMVVGPTGEVLAEAGDGVGQVAATVQRSVLERCREQNPSLANRRM